MVTESPLEMKQAFYIPLKVLFVFKMIKFLPGLLAMQKDGLIGKVRLISKTMTSQPGKPTFAIKILCNISRSKSNQEIKFGQLIEYNIKNIFLKKSYTKCGGETIRGLFCKKSKFSILHQ